MTIGGGLGFWVANFAISLTPVAAEYRAALSISYFSMLFEAMLGGLIIGFSVGYCLLRFFSEATTKSPILKSVTLSFVVLIMVTMFVEFPATFLTTTMRDASRYFFIGTMFNGLRILALGAVIGYLYGKLNRSVRN